MCILLRAGALRSNVSALIPSPLEGLGREADRRGAREAGG